MKGLLSIKPSDLNQSPEEARRARISSVYREKPEKVHDCIGPAFGPGSLREQVLRLSLFPNIFNSKMVKNEF
jgi:hypothetical protein